jgi:patatin-like phospholipase/acyl hydrolase
MKNKKDETVKRAATFADLPEDMKTYLITRERQRERAAINARFFNKACEDVHLLLNAARPETIKDDFFRDLLLNVLGRIGANLENLEPHFEESPYTQEFTDAHNREAIKNPVDDYIPF